MWNGCAYVFCLIVVNSSRLWGEWGCQFKLLLIAKSPCFNLHDSPQNFRKLHNLPKWIFCNHSSSAKVTWSARKLIKQIYIFAEELAEVMSSMDYYLKDDEYQMLMRVIRTRSVTSIVQTILRIDYMILHLKSALLAEQRVLNDYQPAVSVSRPTPVQRRSHSQPNDVVSYSEFF